MTTPRLSINPYLVTNLQQESDHYTNHYFINAFAFRVSQVASYALMAASAFYSILGLPLLSPTFIVGLVLPSVGIQFLTQYFEGRMNEFQPKYEEAKGKLDWYKKIENFSEEQVADFLIQYRIAFNYSLEKGDLELELKNKGKHEFIKKYVLSRDARKALKQQNPEEPHKALLPALAQFLYWNDKVSEIQAYAKFYFSHETNHGKADFNQPLSIPLQLRSQRSLEKEPIADRKEIVARCVGIGTEEVPDKSWSTWFKSWVYRQPPKAATIDDCVDEKGKTIPEKFNEYAKKAQEHKGPSIDTPELLPSFREKSFALFESKLLVAQMNAVAVFNSMINPHTDTTIDNLGSFCLMSPSERSLTQWTHKKTNFFECKKDPEDTRTFLDKDRFITFDEATEIAMYNTPEERTAHLYDLIRQKSPRFDLKPEDLSAV